MLDKPSLEVIYEGSPERWTARVTPPADGAGCHGGRETMLAAARAAGKSEALDRLLADYPRGPHDQPQSMCPAFGSLRVGLRMRRTATILSGSACCVYGLTFTSHFYGAQAHGRLRAVQLAKRWCAAQLFEDIRNAVFETAQAGGLRRRRRHQSVRADRVRRAAGPAAEGRSTACAIIGIDVPGFGVPTHAEAKDVLAGAMLRYARQEAEAGPGARPAQRCRDCRRSR